MKSHECLAANNDANVEQLYAYSWSWAALRHTVACFMLGTLEDRNCSVGPLCVVAMGMLSPYGMFVTVIR